MHAAADPAPGRKVDAASERKRKSVAGLRCAKGMGKDSGRRRKIPGRGQLLGDHAAAVSVHSAWASRRRDSHARISASYTVTTSVLRNTMHPPAITRGVRLSCRTITARIPIKKGNA